MLHKLKLLSLFVSIFLLTGCEEAGDSIFRNLDGDGKLVYLGIILALGVISLIVQLIFKKKKSNKKTEAPSQTQQQPIQQQLLQQQIVQKQTPPLQPVSSPMPPPPSVETINELSKTEPQKETA